MLPAVLPDSLCRALAKYHPLVSLRRPECENPCGARVGDDVLAGFGEGDDDVTIPDPGKALNQEMAHVFSTTIDATLGQILVLQENGTATLMSHSQQ